MHGLPMRVRQSWVKILCQDGRFCSVIKSCTFLNNYTVFEETKCIAAVRTNYPTKLQIVSEIDFLRFPAICLMVSDIRS